MAENRREFLLGAATLAAVGSLSTFGFSAEDAQAQDQGQNTAAGAATASPFVLAYDGSVVTSLRFAGDAFPTDYIEPGRKLGHVEVTWRRSGGAWQRFSSEDAQESTGATGLFHVRDGSGEALDVAVSLKPQESVLRWVIALRNVSSGSIEVGDLALLLPMHGTSVPKGSKDFPVLKHSFISGNGSFLFWMRSNSVGPYLVMTPERDTHLEYWDQQWSRKERRLSYRVFVHSAVAVKEVESLGGRWRQPPTSLTLKPAGQAGAMHTYAFQFAGVRDYAGVRKRLVDAGLIDVEVAPGMTVPTDLATTIAIRSADPVQGVAAEHPAQTTIEALGERAGRKLYRVKFRRLGENMLTVHHGAGRTTRLEFFATEPLETLMRKRAAFTANHQIRDGSKWYDGLLCEWNMQSHVELSPDNYDRITGWRIYEVTCDDPGFSKPAYLAAKNAEFPNQAEVDALDYYIEHFVWGGEQRTTEETYSYGIYGIPDWNQNRHSSEPGPKGRLKLWRCYDYPHYIVMYFAMYRVARDYPGIRTKLDRDAYLERAYGTAMAMFTIPMELVGWSAYQTGFYNEVVIPQVIDELDRVGKHEEASKLRAQWEKKVAFFIARKPNLFGSEYAFDSTGFESTEAIARYAFEHPTMTGITPQETAKFSLEQIRDNLFCRGVVEKAYYYYGSDYRGGGGNSYVLSYMAPMGGWGVLDYALHGPHDSNPRDADATIRLGYASFLSSWALMNTGTKESGYGYWFPSIVNDGGTGGGFEPAAFSYTWLGQPCDRGDWYYSSETDLGHCGALRTAATVVADDAVFGRFCFGGEMRGSRTELEITPRDGLRRRLRLRTAGQKIDLELTGARFAKEQPIRWVVNEQQFRFALEAEPTGSGEALLHVNGLPAGRYRIVCSGETVEFDSGSTEPLRLRVPAGSSKVRVELMRN